MSNPSKAKKLLKWLASAALFATVAGALSGCYVESRHPYYHPYYRHPVIVVR
jgi:hypothetical protein